MKYPLDTLKVMLLENKDFFEEDERLCKIF